ncbi:MAG: hypothetical protein ACOCUI_00215 [bacterium]
MKLPSYYSKENSLKIYPVNYDLILEEFNKKRISSKEKNVCLVLFGYQNQNIKFNDSTVDTTEFIYNNIEKIDDVFIPLLFYSYMSIFSSFFWIDKFGKMLKPGNRITLNEIKNKKIQVNPFIKINFPSKDIKVLEKTAISYLEFLEKKNEFMEIKNFPFSFGSINSCLISIIEEAVFAHSILHQKQPYIMSVGNNPFCEYKSIFSPKVTDIFDGIKVLIAYNDLLIKRVSEYKTIVFLCPDQDFLNHSLKDFLVKSGYNGNIITNLDQRNNKFNLENKYNIINNKKLNNYNL